jgi:hypothetical protein
MLDISILRRQRIWIYELVSRSEIPFGQLRAGTLNEVTSLRGDHAFHFSTQNTILASQRAKQERQENELAQGG